ncbi:MAG: hypothetical protein AAFZ49_07120 [Cyanobacteria bacterium J06659_2]
MVDVSSLSISSGVHLYGRKHNVLYIPIQKMQNLIEIFLAKTFEKLTAIARYLGQKIDIFRNYEFDHFRSCKITSFLCHPKGRGLD